MRFPFKTLPARFHSRPNRFVVCVRLDESGERVPAHCADPGRLRELLVPGVRVHVSYSDAPGRATHYDLRFVEHPESGQLISLDSRLPNAVFLEALQAERGPGNSPTFIGHRSVRSEVSVPEGHGGNSERSGHIATRSRIDFLVEDRAGLPVWVEIKSVTLVEGGIARFPDAPTERGRRHLLELAALVGRDRARAVVAFIVQRPDAYVLEPNEATDPLFARTLADVAARGVELLSYTCTLTLEQIEIDRQIPIHLSSAMNDER